MAQTTLTITGNVSKPPKLCHGKTSGSPFGLVTVAVNEDRFDREQQRWEQTGTTFYDLICFGPMGANMLATLAVGDPVVATGRFRVSAWQTETYRSETPTLTVDNIGPDLRYGTATFTKGRGSYAQDVVDEEVNLAEVKQDEVPGSSTGDLVAAVRRFAEGEQDHAAVPEQDAGTARDAEPADGEIQADQDGVVDDESADAVLARPA